MLRELLVPLDGFEQSEAVGRWAGRFAAVIGAQVTLLGVVSSKREAFGDVQQRITSSSWNESDNVEAQVEGYLSDLASEIADNGSRPNVIVRKGAADSEIPSAARELGVDAVVLVPV